MVLSFHPCFVGDRNRICAGREPDNKDLAVIREASCVILPQGCRAALHEMARQNARHVFPDYTARFRYPGKLGQIRLFRETGAPHPETRLFETLQDFYDPAPATAPAAFSYPYIFKFNWGGEGDTVFAVHTAADLEQLLRKAADFESGGRFGFLTQAYLPPGNRVLRVIVIGTRFIAYWRVQPETDQLVFSLKTGATIDAAADPALREAGINVVKNFCAQTRINLAGFDLLFSGGVDAQKPYLIEINYFFGRRGIGGSERYYALLNTEIRRWLNTCIPG